MLLIALRTQSIDFSGFWRIVVVTQPRYDLWIFQSLRRIMRAVDLYSAKLSAKHRITSPQLICLLTLRADGPLTTSALAKLIHLSNSTVVGILDRLEKRGLIARERGREDRRLVLVTITQEGLDLVSKAPSPLQDQLAEALLHLPVDDQAAIALALDRVVQLMEVPDIQAAPMLASGPIDLQPEPGEGNEGEEG